MKERIRIVFDVFCVQICKQSSSVVVMLELVDVPTSVKGLIS